MRSSLEFANLFKKSVNCLENNNIEFVVVGGSVLSYFSSIRSTVDIDIMLHIKSIDYIELKGLVKCFNENSISITYDEMVDAFNKKIHVTGFDETTWTYRLDIKMISSEFDLFTFKNRIMAPLYGTIVPITSAESLIATKISDGFQSDQDLEDIISIIETSELDYNLLIQGLN